MGWIIALIALGILLYVAELVLLPGITIAAVGAIISIVSAIVLGYTWYGGLWGTVILLTVIAIMVVFTIISLRSKTWKRFSLQTNIDSKAADNADESVAEGETGMTITRLAPMGKVSVAGRVYEAKSVDKYIDQGREVEVVAFENSQIVVRLK